jgi:hypothetical protein
MLLLLLASMLGARLAERAGNAAGLATVRALSPSVHDDCSGFVSAIYRREGIDLSAASLRETAGENGVGRMHRLARERRALREKPRPGDLVFFRDTYRHGLSHVGIVERVRGSGVIFVHRTRRGIVRSRLDLRRPHERSRNDVLRRGPRPALAGELLVGFAAPDPLPILPGWNRCSRSSLASCPSATSSTSRSGTDSAASRIARAERWTSAAATAARSPGTFRRSSRP